MSEAITLLAMFEDFEPASEGIEKLHELGLNDDQMNVISGIPVKNTILGRPSAVTYVSRIGMFIDSGFPSYTPKEYVPEISDGKIAILFSCPSSDQRKFVDALKKLGATSVETAEARQL